MNLQVQKPQTPSLVALLGDLAGEIDGIVDFGLLVCWADKEKMAGRDDYLLHSCSKVHFLVEAVAGLFQDPLVLPPNLSRSLQGELAAHAQSFLEAYKSLGNYRQLNAQQIRSAAEAMTIGWEAVHQSIREIAEACGVVSEPWYSAIIERQDFYRNNVRHVCVCFVTGASTDLPSSQASEPR